MALKLSKRGWNNVLIFAILLFIIVINFSQQRLLDHTEDSPILAPSAQVLSIQTAVRQLDRLGPSWRASDEVWNTAAVEAWLALWFEPYPVTDANPNISLDKMIRMQLLAQQEPIVFILDESLLRIQPANSDWAWQLSQQQFDDFARMLIAP
ncbi:hypothetical protein GCM10011369_36190 [Neiella marina]|uniref:Uncharacterized protein n=1 Tax=Neiella marina TaxID=508461 RepID=A0A8J2UAL9_9GAMM|nr:hypothetical protein [Neiella marina]GGA90839.1 hypothetical protein GCM10011369_36190 [Neiella marina]